MKLKCALALDQWAVVPNTVGFSMNRISIVNNVRVDDRTTNFYRPQRSWGKVIFSVACVKNFVHRGRYLGRYPLGRYTPRQVSPGQVNPPGQLPPRQAHSCRQVHPLGRYTSRQVPTWAGTPQTGTPSWAGTPQRYYEIWSMSGWYTS